MLGLFASRHFSPGVFFAATCVGLGHRLFISIFRDKTVKQHMTSSCCPGKSCTLSSESLSGLSLILLQSGFEFGKLICKVSPGQPPLSLNRFLVILNNVVPAVEPTPLVKGHFTGHSFRRGHAQAAIAHGVDLDDLMLFGNWKAAPSVKNYSAGAVKASQVASVMCHR